MAVTLYVPCPVIGQGYQALDNNGNPLSGGSIGVFFFNTNTFEVLSSSRDSLVARPNPIVLDAAGRIPNNQGAYLSPQTRVRYEIRDAAGTLVNSISDVIPVEADVVQAGSASFNAKAFGVNPSTVAATASNELVTALWVKKLLATGTGTAVQNWNDPSNNITGAGPGLLFGTSTNGPLANVAGVSGTGGSYMCFNFEFGNDAKVGTGNLIQLAIPTGQNDMYIRGRSTGVWQSWRKITISTI